MHYISQPPDISVNHFFLNNFEHFDEHYEQQRPRGADRAEEGASMTIDGEFMPSIKAFLDAHNVVAESWGCFFVCFGTMTARGMGPTFHLQQTGTL
jgi:hypothetical protein